MTIGSAVRYITDCATQPSGPDQAWHFAGPIWVQSVCKDYL